LKLSALFTFDYCQLSQHFIKQTARWPPAQLSIQSSVSTLLVYVHLHEQRSICETYDDNIWWLFNLGICLCSDEKPESVKIFSNIV